MSAACCLCCLPVLPVLPVLLECASALPLDVRRHCVCSRACCHVCPSPMWGVRRRRLCHTLCAAGWPVPRRRLPRRCFLSAGPWRFDFPLCAALVGARPTSPTHAFDARRRLQVEWPSHYCLSLTFTKLLLAPSVRHPPATASSTDLFVLGLDSAGRCWTVLGFFLTPFSQHRCWLPFMLNHPPSLPLPPHTPPPPTRPLPF